MQNHFRVRSLQEPTDFFFSGWFANSKNQGGCVTRLKTLVLIGCCSSSSEINYHIHNKLYIMFFTSYVLCLFSITKLVVLLNWPVAQTRNRKLVEKIFLNQRTSTIFGGQVDWNFHLSARQVKNIPYFYHWYIYIYI